MKFQFSAGGVVFKGHDILLCQHSQHHGWVFPKGIINKKETKEQTALREVKEETGINGKIIKALKPVEYWFVLPRAAGSRGAGEGEKIKKTVYFFLMKYVSGDVMKHDYEMEAVEWLTKDKVKERLTYESDKQVWQEAKGLI